ncbi:MAG: hypothetical protein L3J00_02970 [Thiomicrorhabdus sp.]|nr:hypothetical protein [Thiomicrorhabdus sp.]
MIENNQQNIIIYDTTDGKALVKLYAQDGKQYQADLNAHQQSAQNIKEGKR